MDIETMAAQAEKYLGRVHPRILARIYRGAKAVPFVRRKLDEQYDSLMADLESDLKPYR